MAIKAILFDAGGVLYHRPRQDHHLSEFLSQHGLKLRHRTIVQRALKAGLFDVQSGRITRETFYNAVLRVHGVEDDALFAPGRLALLRDAADIELFPGVREVLNALHDAGYKLGVLSDSAHPARDKVTWLSSRNVSPGLWHVFMVSSDEGMLKAGGVLFERAIEKLGIGWDEVAFVGHDTDELINASALGLTTIAFMPDDPGIETDFAIASFYGLRDLFLDGEDGL